MRAAGAPGGAGAGFDGAPQRDTAGRRAGAASAAQARVAAGGGADVVIVPTREEVAERSAALVIRAINETLARRPEAHIALNGGATPAGVFRVLASRGTRERVDWSRVHLWWGDDRFVPRGDPLCNVWIADVALFRAEDGAPGIPSPLDHVHPFPGGRAIEEGRDADWCAREYAAEIRRLVPVDREGWPRFDMMMVGIGLDGHLLSVFPGSRAFDSPEWALGIPAPTHVEPHVPRVTLNPRILSAAGGVLAIVAGPNKAAILGEIFGSVREPRRLPGQLALRPGATWVIDEAAAARLTIGRRTGESGPDDSREASMSKQCAHLDQIRDVTPSADGCEDCLKIGGTWVHLRLCLTCGHVGCCDNSPNKHATKHFHEIGHPIIRSHEPGETWRWCYADDFGWDHD